ncbi:MAG TPA: hypothetical protein PKD03_07970 [Ignavibacteriaceae bacterium]|nr:hypothetical protein [Ignavibacteriaceae bacterium]
MNDATLQALVWQKIIRLAFSPASSIDNENWLNCCARSIPAFWGIPVQPTKNRGVYTFENPYLNLSYECSISGTSKGAIILQLELGTGKTLMWTHDIDHKYYQFDVHKANLMDIKLKPFFKKLDKIVFDVLDGLIFHPTVHQHIDLHIPNPAQNTNTNITNHEVRVGGGISNPYLFLFQLRYQFCVVNLHRENEKTRLKNLFIQELVSKTIKISPGKLFNLDGPK